MHPSLGKLPNSNPAVLYSNLYQVLSVMCINLYFINDLVDNRFDFFSMASNHPSLPSIIFTLLSQLVSKGTKGQNRQPKASWYQRVFFAFLDPSHVYKHICLHIHYVNFQYFNNIFLNSFGSILNFAT